MKLFHIEKLQKYRSFLKNGIGTTGYPHAKEWSWAPLHTACTRINSKCTPGLDVISKTIKQLKESIEVKKLFLRYDPKISGEKEKHR